MARVFTSDIISVADSSALQNPDTAVTLGGWVSISNSPGDYQRLFGKGIGNYGTTPYVSYNIQQNSTNTRQLEFNINDGTNIFSSGITSALSVDTWYFVAGRWSSGNAVEIRVFNADGTLLSSNSTGTPSGSIAYDTTPFEMTDGGDGGAKPDGSFANILLDNISYTDGQIKHFMFTGRPAGACDLLLPLMTSTEVDLSGNKGSITVTGTVQGDGPPVGPMFGLDTIVPFPAAAVGGATGKSNPMMGPLGGPIYGAIG